jgi:hypothetical protein
MLTLIAPSAEALRDQWAMVVAHALIGRADKKEFNEDVLLERAYKIADKAVKARGQK